MIIEPAAKALMACFHVIQQALQEVLLQQLWRQEPSHGQEWWTMGLEHPNSPCQYLRLLLDRRPLQGHQLLA